MSPPGTPVSGSSDQTIADEGIGLNAAKGWTIEAWIKLGPTNQSGAIARYALNNSSTNAFVAGISSNRPYLMVRGAGGAFASYPLTVPLLVTLPVTVKLPLALESPGASRPLLVKAVAATTVPVP
jgi:hypothetical protein